MLPITAAIVLFLITSLIIGRGSSEFKDVDDMLELSMEVPGRIFEGNQVSGVIGFRYIYPEPIRWGKEWLVEVKQMLPGLKDQNHIPIDSLIFASMYGSTRGTAPLSLIGSLWYNFYIIGITILPLIFGVIYQKIYHLLIKGRKTLFRLMVFSGLAGVLGVWGSGGINTLLNTGVATILLFLILGKWVLGMDLKRKYAEVNPP